MNTPNLQAALPPARTELREGTLDERIALAEQRMVSREQSVRQSAQALLQRAQDATKPRRMLRPAMFALGTLAVVWGVGRLLGPRRRVNRPVNTPATSIMPITGSVSRLREVPWVRVADLIWPLLPVAWRGRMAPGSASVLVAVGVPLAGLLFKKRAHAPLQSRGSAEPPTSARQGAGINPTEELR